MKLLLTDLKWATTPEMTKASPSTSLTSHKLAVAAVTPLRRAMQNFATLQMSSPAIVPVYGRLRASGRFIG